MATEEEREVLDITIESFATLEPRTIRIVREEAEKMASYRAAPLGQLRIEKME